MNREILFRAKRYESNEWVEGFYLQNEAGDPEQTIPNFQLMIVGHIHDQTTQP